MIYTEMTCKAMRIAYQAHNGQTDKSGMPYIFHPFHLAEQMKTEEEVCAALLHDVAEDTEITLEELAAQGFPKAVTDALKLLTHEPHIPYMDYVAEIAKNPTARAVKLADLRHNSDLSRFEAVGIEPTERDIARREKYMAAIELLKSSCGESR